MPSSRHARWIRRAISPRFAIRIFLNIAPACPAAASAAFCASLPESPSRVEQKRRPPHRRGPSMVLFTVPLLHHDAALSLLVGFLFIRLTGAHRLLNTVLRLSDVSLARRIVAAVPI